MFACGLWAGREENADDRNGNFQRTIAFIRPQNNIRVNEQVFPCYEAQRLHLAICRPVAADCKEAEVGRQKDERIGDREELRGQTETVSSQPRGNPGVPRARSAHGQPPPDDSSGRLERWGDTAHPAVPGYTLLPVVPA